MLAPNDVMEDEDHLVGRYLGRLRQSLRKVMFVRPCYTLTEAILHTTAIKESHTIEIPQSRASIPQTAKDEVRSKKYRQLLKEDNAIGSSNRPKLRWVDKLLMRMARGKAKQPSIVSNAISFVTYLQIVEKGRSTLYRKEESDDPSSYAADDDQPKIDDSGATTILFMVVEVDLR